MNIDKTYTFNFQGWRAVAVIAAFAAFWFVFGVAVG